MKRMSKLMKVIFYKSLWMLSFILLTGCEIDLGSSTKPLERGLTTNDNNGYDIEGTWYGVTTSTQYNRIDYMDFEYSDTVSRTSYIVIRKNENNNYEISDCTSGFIDLEIDNNKLTLNELEYEVLSESSIQGSIRISDPAEGLYEQNVTSTYTKIDSSIDPIGHISRQWAGAYDGESLGDIYCAELQQSTVNTSDGQDFNDVFIIFNGVAEGYEYYMERKGTKAIKFVRATDALNSMIGSNMTRLTNVSAEYSSVSESGFILDFTAQDEDTKIDATVKIDVISQ